MCYTLQHCTFLIIAGGGGLWYKVTCFHVKWTSGGVSIKKFCLPSGVNSIKITREERFIKRLS